MAGTRRGGGLAAWARGSRPDKSGRWGRPVEWVAVAVAVLAAAVSIWQAVSARNSLAEQRAAARAATADQVVILGDSAEIPSSQWAIASPWPQSILGDTPTRVQNYGRLPVSDVVIRLDFESDTQVVTYLVPVGPLAPCQEVEVVAQVGLSEIGITGDLRKVFPGLRVYYTDPAGFRWVRGTNGPPTETRDGPPSVNGDSIRSNEDLVRSDIVPFQPCGNSG
jgi:hypothetical protein